MNSGQKIDKHYDEFNAAITEDIKSVLKTKQKFCHIQMNIAKMGFNGMLLMMVFRFAEVSTKMLGSHNSMEYSSFVLLALDPIDLFASIKCSNETSSEEHLSSNWIKLVQNNLTRWKKNFFIVQGAISFCSWNNHWYP